VRDRLFELRNDAAGNGLDPELSAALGDVHSSRTARDHRQRRLERTAGEIHAVRR
jgi:hypothetical protein